MHLPCLSPFSISTHSDRFSMVRHGLQGFPSVQGHSICYLARGSKRSKLLLTVTSSDCMPVGSVTRWVLRASCSLKFKLPSLKPGHEENGSKKNAVFPRVWRKATKSLKFTFFVGFMSRDSHTRCYDDSNAVRLYRIVTENKSIRVESWRVLPRRY